MTEPTNIALAKATSSLTRKTMLVTFRSDQFSNSLQDDSAKQQFATTASANSDAIRVSKQKFDPRHIAPIKKAISDARTYYYKMTLPWSTGWRLLPTKLHFEFENQMRQFKQEMQNAIQGIEPKFDGMVINGQNRLGSLASSIRYPTKQEFLASWDFWWKYEPVPAAGHLIADIAQSDLDEIREQLEKSNHDQLQETTRHLYGRIHELTSHMKETLSNPKAKFKDTLVSNIAKLTEILEPLNIADDPDINRLASELQSSLGSYSPQDLRDDEAIRAKAASEAAAATDQVTSILSRLGMTLPGVAATADTEAA